MKIIIVGIGKVGYAIAEQMTGENHDLVVIDRDSAVLDHVDSMLDVMCVEGNGASASVLLEAGVREADLLIAVSENDEVNLICCLMAKKLGAKLCAVILGHDIESKIKILSRSILFINSLLQLVHYVLAISHIIQLNLNTLILSVYIPY